MTVKKKFLDRTITIKKILLITIPILLVLTLYVMVRQSDTYRYMFEPSTFPNPAKSKVADIDFVLKSHDASVICSSGHNGQGFENNDPAYYHVVYSVQDSKVIDKEIVGYGKRSGFDPVPSAEATKTASYYKSVVIENERPDAVPDHGLYQMYQMTANIYRGDIVNLSGCSNKILDLKNKKGYAIVEIKVDYKGNVEKNEYKGDDVKYIDYDFNRYINE
jgi:hypothetical protein